MGQEEKDRFDACMKMVDFRMRRIESRRQHEWKVTVAVWALLAAGILKLPHVHWLMLLVGLVVLSALHLCWVLHHWVESKIDTTISFFYHDAVRQIACQKVPKILANANSNSDLCEDAIKKLAWRQPLVWGQVLTTLLFAMALEIMNCYR